MKTKDLRNELHKKESSVSSDAALDIDIDRVKERVACQLDFADVPRRSINMRVKKRIVVLIAAVAALMAGTAVFAATGHIANLTGSSSSKADYTSLPTADQMVREVGYEPVLINIFENGYRFDSGNIVKTKLKDDSENVVEKSKSLSFEYKKGGDTVEFTQMKCRSQLDLPGTVITTADDTDLYYSHYTNKFVPEDYQMTAQDKQDEASGKVVFSYGSSKVEKSEVQSVTWKKDGVQYQLLQMDGMLSSEELAAMAEEVLNEISAK